MNKQLALQQQQQQAMFSAFQEQQQQQRFQQLEQIQLTIKNKQQQKNETLLAILKGLVKNR